MSEPVLKPCPFCGAAPIIISENNFHSVFCYRCLGNSVKTRVTKFGDPELAFAAWNHRPGEYALMTEVEYLIASLHNRDAILEAYRIEVEQLNLQLAQAKAAISIIDPATGTGAFLGNPPFGEKDDER